jgi:hypothetical protein
MKVALCFIISYEHILNKESIWKKWIESNKDIINVYFFYKDKKCINSKWILDHCIPENFIYETNYYNVVPAYLSLFRYALLHDKQNLWLCMLTDSCVPIVSPQKFRYMFFKYHQYSLFSWKRAWWNIKFHTRANLNLLDSKFHLGNDPYFIISREYALYCLSFLKYNTQMSNTIISGGLANESFFAIALEFQSKLDNSLIINKPSHMVDWSRMKSATSPYLFKEESTVNNNFIEKNLPNDNYLFLRKVHKDLPDSYLEFYIYDYNKKKDNNLIIKKPYLYYYNRYFYYFIFTLFSFLFSISIYYYNQYK